MSVLRAVFLGGLVVGILDGLDAIVFVGLRGAALERIFQAIAAGVIGQGAYQGGVATTALGVALHFFIATSIVLTYVVASRVWPVLVRRPVVGLPAAFAARAARSAPAEI
jgi:hypothetical protein